MLKVTPQNIFKRVLPKLISQQKRIIEQRLQIDIIHFEELIGIQFQLGPDSRYTINQSYFGSNILIAPKFVK